MSGLIMAAQLILGLSILVILHELGHFLAARAFGIKVEKFYLFFDAWGVKLFKFKKGNTEYGVGWLPLGGYVKIAGMIDESLDTKALKSEPQPWEFRAKPAWQRLIVMLGGVTMNLILGIILYTYMLYSFTGNYLPVSSVKDGIYAYGPAKNVGFQTGDKIVAIDGKEIERFEDVISTRVLFGSTVTVERNGLKTGIIVPDTMYKMYMKKEKENFINAHNFKFTINQVTDSLPAFKAGLKKDDKILSINGTAVESYGHFRELMTEYAGKKVSCIFDRKGTIDTIDLNIDKSSMIGIKINTPYQKEKYTLGKAIKYGYRDAFETLYANAKGLLMIFKGKEKATESIQGPIGIAKIYGGTWDWKKFVSITALLSLVLAFMNVLPIPALDGGHVIFLTIEAITRKKFSDKFMERAQIVGMVILLAIMVFAVGNDIFKLFK